MSMFQNMMFFLLFGQEKHEISIYFKNIFSLIICDSILYVTQNLLVISTNYKLVIMFVKKKNYKLIIEIQSNKMHLFVFLKRLIEKLTYAQCKYIENCASSNLHLKSQHIKCLYSFFIIWVALMENEMHILKDRKYSYIYDQSFMLVKIQRQSAIALKPLPHNLHICWLILEFYLWLMRIGWQSLHWIWKS
jgi:hypothetical protein